MPLHKTCKKCGDPPRCHVTTQQTQAPTDADVDDGVWAAILANPVTRSIPAGARLMWYSTLTTALTSCRADSPPEAFLRLAAFCRIALAPLGRGGKRHCRQATTVFLGRLARWNAGQHYQLAVEYLREVAEKPPSRTATTDASEGLPEPIRRAALRAVNEGALGKAARVLSEHTYSLPTKVLGALELLHPRADCPLLPTAPCQAGEDFTPEDIADCLRTFPPGSAGGFSGLIAAHLRPCKSSEYCQLLKALARVCSDFAWGRLPPESSAILASARLIPIGKKDHGVRPIAVGEIIRRMVASA